MGIGGSVVSTVGVVSTVVLPGLLAPASLARSAGSAQVSLASVASRNAGSNPDSYRASAPILGAPWSATVDLTTTGHDSALLRWSPNPAAIPLVNGKTLLIGSPNLPVATQPGPVAQFNMLVPNDPSLAGRVAYTQAVHLAGAPYFRLSNAQDLTFGSGRDITVLVVEETGAAGAPAPVSGAQVTLRGRDASSWTGAVQATAADGTALFQGVAGPFDVTAQVDRDFGGATTRVASSLIGANPALSGASGLEGTIGVLLFTDEDEFVAPDATLQGVVSNLPTLAGNEFVEVVAVARGPKEFERSAFVDAGTGSYSMTVPSGVLLDCFVAHREDPSFENRSVLASLLAPGVGQATPGGTLSVSFDFADPAVVPWNRVVPLAVSNVHPAASLGLQLLVEDPISGVGYDFSFFDGFVPPASIRLPDASDPRFAGYRVELGADTEDPFGMFDLGQDCGQVLTATPASVSMDFFSLPAILEPSYLEVVPYAEWPGHEVRVSEAPSGSFGTNGLDLVFVATEAGASGPPPAGIDQTLWALFLRAGTTSFELPPYSLPMFGSTQVLSMEMEQERFAGYAFDFDAFFDGNVAANLQMLDSMSTASCSSASGIAVFLTP